MPYRSVEWYCGVDIIMCSVNMVASFNTFKTIHAAPFIYISFQEFVLKKLLARKKVGRVGKAQIKIMAVIIYYTILGVMGLVAYTVFEVADSYRKTIVQYVLCESTGLSECEVTNDNTILILSKLVIIMISLLPVVAILFNCDPKAWKKFRDGKKFKAARSYQRSDAATSKLK